VVRKLQDLYILLRTDIFFPAGWEHLSRWPQLLWGYTCPYGHARWWRYKVLNYSYRFSFSFFGINVLYTYQLNISFFCVALSKVGLFMEKMQEWKPRLLLPTSTLIASVRIVRRWYFICLDIWMYKFTVEVLKNWMIWTSRSHTNVNPVRTWLCEYFHDFNALNCFYITGIN